MLALLQFLWKFKPLLGRFAGKDFLAYRICVDIPTFYRQGLLAIIYIFFQFVLR